MAAADDGHVLTGSEDNTGEAYGGDELVRTIKARTNSWVWAAAVRPGGARAVGGSTDDTAELRAQ